MTKHKTFLTLITWLYFSLQMLDAQALSDCKVEAWQGRRTNFQIAKIPVYMGNSLKNAPVTYYDRRKDVVKVWETRADGKVCLADKVVYDSIYVVNDTLKCRDFKVYYFASYRDLVTEGKKVKTKGICPNKMTPQLKKALLDKLVAEDVLLEIPDENVPNWEHVWLIAIMNYQQKYDLAVGLLTLETAKHMGLP
jgi:hypothetical protein